MKFRLDSPGTDGTLSKFTRTVKELTLLDQSLPWTVKELTALDQSLLRTVKELTALFVKLYL